MKRGRGEGRDQDEKRKQEKKRTETRLKRKDQEKVKTKIEECKLYETFSLHRDSLSQIFLFEQNFGRVFSPTPAENQAYAIAPSEKLMQQSEEKITRERQRETDEKSQMRNIKKRLK